VSYVEELKSKSDLKVLHECNVITVFARYAELGLFHLFLLKSWFKAMLQWTNKSLQSKGKKKISLSQLMAYVGLEVAMSIVPLNCIKDYWNSSMFLQQQDFGKVMSREVFEVIHANIVLHDPELFNHEQASHDPLYHSRNLLNHFIQSAAKVAVPIGTSALDENSAQTKAHTRAKSYNADKPDTFAIRFYAVVSSTFTYCHSMVDNRSGNTTPENTTQAYCRLFPEMRTPYNNILCASDSAVKGESASALWVLQMAHHTKQHQDPSGKRVFFMDNFYTRHTLGMLLKKITDGEAHLCETVQFTNVDATNRYYLKTTIKDLKDKPRGSWFLVRAYNKTPNYDQLQWGHTAQQHRLPKATENSFHSSNGDCR
jgi:hypothetical protein